MTVSYTLGLEISMATLTIRNVPDEVVDRIKSRASQKGISMEQEVRNLLHSRYQQREAVLKRIRQRWDRLPPQSADQIQAWKEKGRP